MMEGYLDVARAIEAGVTGAVATCGTALTGQHARLLARFAKTVVLNFDQDEAGQKAARKSLDVLLEEGLSVRIVELPEGHDPDTYLKAEGAEAYRKRLDEAPEAIEWLMRRAAERHDVSAPAGKAAFLADVMPALVRTQNAVERQAWLARVVERGGLDPGAAREETRRALGGPAGLSGRLAGGGGGGAAGGGAPAGAVAAAGGALAAGARRAGRGGHRACARRAARRGRRRARLGGHPARGAGRRAEERAGVARHRPRRAGGRRASPRFGDRGRRSSGRASLGRGVRAGAATSAAALADGGDSEEASRG